MYPGCPLTTTNRSTIAATLASSVNWYAWYAVHSVLTTAQSHSRQLLFQVWNRDFLLSSARARIRRHSYK